MKDIIGEGPENAWYKQFHHWSSPENPDGTIKYFYGPDYANKVLDFKSGELVISESSRTDAVHREATEEDISDMLSAVKELCSLDDSYRKVVTVTEIGAATVNVPTTAKQQAAEVELSEKNRQIQEGVAVKGDN